MPIEENCMPEFFLQNFISGLVVMELGEDPTKCSEPGKPYLCSVAKVTSTCILGAFHKVRTGLSPNENRDYR